VTDAKGRTTTVRRTVTVEPAKQPETVQPEGKVIYLTFDDGPSSYTDKLLAVLAKYNVKATFFIIGENASQKRLQAIVNGGHSIAIHTMTHDFAEIYSSEEAFLKDLYDTQTLIYEATGVKTTLMRFPGGTSNTVSRKHCKGIMTRLTQTVTDLGFQYFDWNVDSYDAGGAKTADEVYKNVTSGIKGLKTAYVLQHDSKGFSVDAVERIIQWGLENGYTFLPLTPESPAHHHRPQN
jgi:peptidoglycan/xylan/chitin deacetylase (PgdA/CDA1 family)